MVLVYIEKCMFNQSEVSVTQHQIKPATVILLAVSLMMFSYGFGVYQSKQSQYEQFTVVQDSLIVMKKKLSDMRSKLLPKTINDVTFTSYNPTEAQTDSDPFITASGDSVDEWTLAVSRDMLIKHSPDGIFSYSDTVYAIIPMVVRDTMNKRYEKRADILSFDAELSKMFGKRKGYLAQF